MKTQTQVITYKQASNLFHLATLAKRNGLTTLHTMLMAEHNEMLKKLEAKAGK